MQQQSQDRQPSQGEDIHYINHLGDKFEPSSFSQEDKMIFEQLNSTSFRKFGFFDIALIASVFLLGFVFSLVMSSYKKRQKQQLDDLIQEFQGQKGRYEKALFNTRRLYKLKYRVKIAEKVYYIMLLLLFFVFYKSPNFFNYAVVINGHFTIPAASLSVIILIATGWYLEGRHKE